MLVWSAIAAALLLAASCLGALLLRRGTAAARHQLWALGVSGALAMPLFSALVPPLPVPSFGVGQAQALLAPAVVVTGAAPVSGSPSWLGLAWALGALLVAVRFLGGHLAARRLWRGAAPAPVPALADAAAALGVTGRVDVRRSPAIGSPMTLGVWRARVLLPAAADAWSPERLRAILIHELGHVRRRDTLVQVAAQLACALYWWNPLAWLASARLRVEREHACDDLVLGAGVLPSSYAADLLDVARGVASGEPARAGAACMVEASGTGARIRRVLDPAAPRRPLGRTFRVATRAATLAMVATLACTSAPRPKAAPAVAAAATLPMKLGSPFVDERGLPPWLQGPAPVDLALVAKAVEPGRADLDRCYQRRLAARPGLKGAVMMRLTLTPVGVGDQVVQQDGVSDPEILSCVEQVIQAAQFPAPAFGSVDIVVPFLFGVSDPGC